MENETKVVCPKCAEEVKAEATVCKHCGSKIKPISAEKLKKQTTSPVVKWLVILVFTGIVVSSTISALQDPELTGSTPVKEDICQMGYLKSKRFVTEVLKSPSTANFPSYELSATDLGDSRCEINAYVDSQNSFGAEMRSYWTTTVKFNGGSKSDTANWTLEEMVFDGEQVYP